MTAEEVPGICGAGERVVATHGNVAQREYKSELGSTNLVGN